MTKKLEKMTAHAKQLGFASIEEAKEELQNYVAKDDAAPQVWVGTYGKYNNGALVGKWLDLNQFTDYDEFVKMCKVLHIDEDDPEFMLNDFMNFPKKFYSESMISREDFDELKEFLSLTEHEQEVVGEYWEEIYEEVDMQDVLDHFAYEGNPYDYFDMLADEMFDQYTVPDILRNCFDWEKWRSQCEWDYDTTTNYVFYHK